MTPAFTLLTVSALVAAAYGSIEIPSRIFPADSELIYNYVAHVSTGVTQPQDFLSHFSIQGKLRIQTVGEKAKFRLEDVLFSTYNGKGNRQKLPADDYVSIPVPNDAKAISKPFVAIFKDGKNAAFEYETSDTLWSRNLKRSIVSQFQVDLKEFSHDLPRVFTSDEMGISGECKVENVIVYGGKPDSYSLRKSQDASRCKGPKYWYDNLSLSSCATTEPKSATSTSTERNYHLKIEKDSVIIQKIKSRSVTSFQPLWVKGELQYVFINQTFTKDSQGAIPVPLIVGDTTPSTLTFEFQDSASGSGPDMIFERYSLPIDELVTLTQKTLVKSAEKLTEMPEADATKLYETNVFHYLLTYMRHLDFNGLRKVADFALLGTSSKDESIQQIFTSFLPKVGTHAAAILTKDLIVKKELNVKQSLMMLVDLPFNLRYPAANLLRECKEFLTLSNDINPAVRKTALLTFASMVGRICKTGICSPALLDEYVKLFFGRLRDSKDYDEQMLYIQALGNIKISPVSTYLEPIIRGKLNYPRQLRFQAIWAAADELMQDPEKIHEIYWPILADRRNHLELRVGAMTMLLMSKPTTDGFMNILWYMVSDPSFQLYQFFYSTIKSLSISTFPCYSKLSVAAQQISRMVPKPLHEPSYLTTSNEIIDFVDPDIDVGQMHQLISIGSDRSDISDVMYFHFTKHIRGQVHNPISVLLRTEGFNNMQARNVMDSKNKDVDGDDNKLQGLFKALKIEHRNADPMHVEFILQVQGRAVISQYFNETGIAEMTDILGKLQGLAASQHFNNQNLQQAVFYESIFPSDLGTPITIESTNLPVMSSRGNLSFSFKAPILSASIDLDSKFNIRQGFGVRTFNPISALWYGVHRPSIHVMAVPINVSLSFDIQQKSLKIQFGWNKNTPLINTVSHGRSNTFVAGSPQMVNAVLPQTCPTCLQFARVVAAKETMKNSIEFPLECGMEISMAQFDCDKNIDVATPFIKPLFMRQFSNYGFSEKDYSNILSVMGLQTEMLMLLDPLLNSCGRQFKITPTQDTSGVEFVFKAETGKGNKRLYRILMNYLKSNGELGQTWDTNIVAEPSEDETKFAMKIKVVRKQEGKPTYVTCLKMDNSYPERGPETYWDQMGQPFESRRTEHRLAVEFGENDESKCPVGKGGQIEVVATSEHQGMDDTTWPFNVCEKQRQAQNFVGDNGQLLYPATHACASASWAPRPRNMSFTVTVNNVPSLDHIMNSQIGSLTLFNKKDKSYKMYMDTMHNQKENSMIVKLRTDDGKEKDYNLPLLVNEAPYILSENLAHYPSIDNFKMALDLIHPCLIAGGQILTFDNATLPFVPTEKFTLISGVCTANSPFAVFARKTSLTTALTLKVFIGDSEIIVEPIPGQRSKVSINGEAFTKDSKLDDSFSIHQKEDGKVNIETENKVFLVRSTHINVGILVPSTYDRYYCGVCGDSNRVPEFQETLGPDNKLISVNEMISAYTLA